MDLDMCEYTEVWKCIYLIILHTNYINNDYL